MPRNRLTIAGISAGIVFAVGFVMVNMVPGLGGTSTTYSNGDGATLQGSALSCVGGAIVGTPPVG